MGRSDDYKNGRVSSVIGKKTVVEGTLTGNELLRIDGLVKGKVVSEGRVIIGRDGKVEGEVRAAHIVVGGVIEGELFSTDKVEVNATGRVYADIHTKNLIVDEKGVFEGRCEMTNRTDTAKEPDDKAEEKEETKEE
ncbi:MAG: polymer-forming cytoskeletal protein [Lachnospiraceae bacterium]|nr:polymer-forming cytoskeletal protein [Lachnospiraceae bacterium]